MRIRDSILILIGSCFLVSPAFAQPEHRGGQDRPSPEQRKEFFQRDGGEKRPKFDPSSERYQKMQEKREAFKKELEGLSPEERQAKMEEFREKRKEEMRKRIDNKFEGKWDQATPEERQRVCDKLRDKCQKHEGRGFACDIAGERCSSY